MMKLLIFGNKHQENKLDGILRMFDILCKTQVDVSVEKASTTICRGCWVKRHPMSGCSMPSNSLRPMLPSVWAVTARFWPQ